jgi:hypothetical protein
VEATSERVMSIQFFRNNYAGFLYPATQLNAFCYSVLGTNAALNFPSASPQHTCAISPIALPLSLKWNTAQQCASVTMTTHNLNNFSLKFQWPSFRSCSFLAAVYDLSQHLVPRESQKANGSVFSVALTERLRCK